MATVDHHPPQPAPPPPSAQQPNTSYNLIWPIVKTSHPARWLLVKIWWQQKPGRSIRQGWTIMTNCTAGRNHRGVLLQSQLFNFFLLQKNIDICWWKNWPTYIDMVLLSLGQDSNWWVSTFVAPPLLAAQTKKERKAHIEFYWLMFCMREESERQSDRPPTVR